MISVLCTKKFAKKLPVNLPTCTEEIPALDKWCINLTKNRFTNIVLAMCVDTCFGFALMDVDEEEFEKLPELIETGIRMTMGFYGIREEIINDYVSEVPKLYVGASQKELGKLNRLTTEAAYNWWIHDLRPELVPIEFAMEINGKYIEKSEHAFSTALEIMLESLEKRYKMKPICRPAFELTATLDLGIFETCRILWVPASSSFDELHRIIKKAFEWHRHYEYKFINRPGQVNDTDKWEYEESNGRETKTFLADTLKAGDTFTYLYRASSTWEVSIRVTMYMPNYDKPFPMCMYCKEVSPREDIGGVEEFCNSWKKQRENSSFAGLLSLLESYPNRDSINYEIRNMYTR